MFNLLKTLDETKLDKEFVHINTSYPLYITMSTIPARMQNTFRIIKHFLKNVSGEYKIILNIPHKYNRWPNLSINVLHDITDKRFILNRTEDIGPLTKFLPSLKLIPKDSILIVCDDMCYKLSAFRDIAERQQQELDKSFSFYVYPYGADILDKRVMVPQGADLISMYSRNVSDFPEWFEDFKKKMNVTNYFDSLCFFVDDQVIGWYMQYKEIPMIQVDEFHRYIYIENCDNTASHNNLNAQKGRNSRDNTMSKCYADLSKAFPL